MVQSQPNIEKILKRENRKYLIITIIVAIVVTGGFFVIDRLFPENQSESNDDSSEKEVTIENYGQAFVNTGSGTFHAANNTSYNLSPEEIQNLLSISEENKQYVTVKNCTDKEIDLTFISCLGFKITRPNEDWHIVTDQSTYEHIFASGDLGRYLIGVYRITNLEGAAMSIFVWDGNDPDRSNLEQLAYFEFKSLKAGYTDSRFFVSDLSDDGNALKAKANGTNSEGNFANMKMNFKKENDKIYYINSVIFPNFDNSEIFQKELDQMFSTLVYFT